MPQTDGTFHQGNTGRVNYRRLYGFVEACLIL